MFKLYWAQVNIKMLQQELRIVGITGDIKRPVGVIHGLWAYLLGPNESPSSQPEDHV